MFLLVGLAWWAHGALCALAAYIKLCRLGAERST